MNPNLIPKKMLHFLKLINYKALLFLTTLLFLIKYALIAPSKLKYNVATSLSASQFLLLVLALVCLVAAGFIIHAIYSVESNKINTPNQVIINQHITESNAFNIYMLLNLIGVGLGYYLANQVNLTALFGIFFLITALLYLHATALQQMPVIGNIIIAFIAGLLLLSVGVFELYPAVNATNKDMQLFLFGIVKDYAIFVFGLTLICSLVADLQNINGHFAVEMQTLPIVIGRNRATKIVFGLALILLFLVAYYAVSYLFNQPVALVYVLLLIMAPLLYVCIKLFNAETKTDYTHILAVIKGIYITTTLSLLLFKFLILK